MVTAVDELLAFMRRCLDEVERVAREALADEPAPWRAYGSDLDAGVATADGGVIRDGDGDMRHTVAEHIARWDPARVLAEVKAKRRILDLHRPIEADDVPGLAQCSFDAEVTPCTHVRLLVQPHAGQPGWREEWQA